MQTEFLINFENVQQFEVLGNEDCLFLNVYTPGKSPQKKNDNLYTIFIYINLYIVYRSNTNSKFNSNGLYPWWWIYLWFIKSIWT